MILPGIPTRGKRPRSACRSVPVPCIIRKPLSLSAFSGGPPEQLRRRCRKSTLACPCILRGHPSPHESPDRRSGVPCLLKQPCAPRTMLRQRARFACPGGFCPIESARPRRCVPFIRKITGIPMLSPTCKITGKPMLSPIYKITGKNPCSLLYTRLPG